MSINMKDRLPTVSIVIPCFNPKEDDLCDALESCLSQTSLPLEILVLDDGSETTNGFKAVDHFKSELVSYHRFPHQGLGLTRNEGNKLTTGEYVVYLDCDDILSPCFVEFVQKLAQKEPDLIAFGIGESVSESFDQLRVDEYTGGDALRFLNRISPGINRPEIRSVCGKAFRLKHLLSNDVWFENVKQGEDQLFMFRLYASRPYIVSAPSFAAYRYITTPSSMSVFFDEGKVDAFADLAGRLWHTLIHYMPEDNEKRREYYYIVACEYIPRLFKIVYCNRDNPKSRRIRRKEASALCRAPIFRQAINKARYTDCLSNGKKYTLLLLKCGFSRMLFWHYENAALRNKAQDK